MNQQPYQQQYPPYPYQQPQPPAGTSLMAVLGFCLSLFPVIPFAGLVLSIAGLAQCSKTGQAGKGWAVAGIAINIIAALLAILLVVGVVAFVTDPGYELLEEFTHFAQYTALR